MLVPWSRQDARKEFDWSAKLKRWAENKKEISIKVAVLLLSPRDFLCIFWALNTQAAKLLMLRQAEREQAMEIITSCLSHLRADFPLAFPLPGRLLVALWCLIARDAGWQ